MDQLIVIVPIVPSVALLGCITLHIHYVTEGGFFKSFYFPLFMILPCSYQKYCLASLCWRTRLQNREEALLTPSSGRTTLTESRSPSKNLRESKLLIITSDGHPLFPLAAEVLLSCLCDVIICLFSSLPTLQTVMIPDTERRG